MTAHRLGLVGSGIDMSLAPAFHVLAGKLVGIEVSYELIPRDPTLAPEFDAFLRQLAADGYHGVNVTVPFKTWASQAAVEPSTDVVATGVANTLLLGPDGPTHAFTTEAIEECASAPQTTFQRSGRPSPRSSRRERA